MAENVVWQQRVVELEGRVGHLGELLTERGEENLRLRLAEQHLRRVLDALGHPFEVIELLYDPQGNPRDYVYCDVNEARIDRLDRAREQVVGYRASQVFPLLVPICLAHYDTVIRTGAPEQFAYYGPYSHRHYKVYAFRPEPGRCAAIHMDVTERKQMEDTLRTTQRLALLAATASDLLQAQSPQTIVDQLCARVLEHLDCHVFFNYLLDREKGRLHLNACAGISAEARRAIEWLDLGVAVCGCVAQQGQRIVAEDVQCSDDPRVELVRSYGVRAYACHPLQVAGQTIGTLSFGTRSRDHFAADEVELMRIVAGQVATAMERQRLNEALREREERYRVLYEQAAEAEIALQEINATLEERIADRTALAENRAQQLRALAMQLTRAEEQERRRLARLLHDDLQQTLVAAMLQLNVAQRAPEHDTQPLIDQALDLLREAVTSSRSLTAELSPAILHEDGLAPALHWLGRWMEERYNLAVAVETAGAPQVPEGLGLILFQCARELLFNVVKHAGVQKAQVALTTPTAGRIQLTVSDNGQGFDVASATRSVAAGGGFGLFSIQERLLYVGGRCVVVSTPGRGTRVVLSAPIDEAEVTTPMQPLLQGERQEQVLAVSKPRTLRLLVVDDHAIVRRGLAGLLNGEPDMEVIGEAKDGLAGLELVRALHPDVVLMDINMPRMDGIEATRRISAEFPDVYVIGLSMFDDAEKETLMRQAGASGYVAKGGPPESLFTAIRNCHGEARR